MSGAGYDRCPYCNSTRGFVYVHSHYQCTGCGNNVNPCCGGEQEENACNQAGQETSTNLPDALLNNENE